MNVEIEMPDSSLDFESSFLQRARYPKGKRTMQTILDATYDLIISEGIAAASQEAIAKRANVTQSAVRHYFPTKEELLYAFFATGMERLQHSLKEKLAEQTDDPRAQLIESAALHYERMLEAEDIYFFEAAAYWGRNPEFRELRDRWYQNLSRHYAELILRAHPSWDKEQCVATAFQVLTLILGGWTTLGSSRPFHKRRSRKALKATLLKGIEKLID